jgi:plasmid rolling circle replication initiator protein Rep
MCTKCNTKQADTGVGNVLLDKLPLTSESAIGKRQIRKAISVQISLKLIELNSPLQKEYERSLTCGSVVKELSDGSTRSWYCGKRWCNVCNGIKQAELIEAYTPALNEMKEPFLVTLTVPAVTADMLSDTIKMMANSFKLIKDRMRKQGFPLNGIRKLEANFNESKKTFNPHYHMLIDGADTSVQLVQNWLKQVSGTRSFAQDIQRADIGSLKELFKYTCKVLVNSRFNPQATDTIMQALKGKRTFQNFGNVKKTPVTFDNEKGAVLTLSDTDKPIQESTGAYVVGLYLWQGDNWYTNTGERLCVSELPPKCIKLIDRIRGIP